MNNCVFAVLSVIASGFGQPAPTSTPAPGSSPTPTPAPAPAPPADKPTDKPVERPARAPRQTLRGEAPAGAEKGDEEKKQAERQPSAKGSMFVGEASELADGFNFTEGPAYVTSGASAGCFIFSDIPNAKIHKVRIDEQGKGTPELLRENSGHTNGNIIDSAGMLISAESDGRITRSDILNKPDAEVEVLAAEFGENRFNSPNDLCVGAKGDVYFTDPAYFYPKDKPKPEFEGVYRIVAAPADAKAGTPRKVELVSRDYKRPNGICLSPDGGKLYVADAGTGELFVHEVKPDGSTGPRALFADTKNVRGRGGVDGLRTDKAGNVYTTGPGGIWCFSPKGQWLDRLTVPMVSNFAFGGKDGTTLLLTSGAKVLVAKSKNPG